MTIKDDYWLSRMSAGEIYWLFGDVEPDREQAKEEAEEDRGRTREGRRSILESLY
jgi:hypothetical protein